MNHCINCGEQNTKEAKFCVHCGFNFGEQEMSSHKEANAASMGASSINQGTQKKSVAMQPAQQSNVQQPVQKMSKNNRILFGIIGAVVLVAIVAHLIIGNLLDPMKKIQAMNEAYNQQDKEAFFNEFHISDGIVADADSFYSLIKDYGWISLRDHLTDEVEKIQENQPTNIISNNHGDLLVLEQKPILLGLYKKVHFTVIPTEVAVYAPYENMTIQLGGQEVISESDDETVMLGQFIPGEYKWSYEYEGGLMPLSGEGTVMVYAQEDHQSFVDIDWGFKTLSIDSDIADAIVYVNGQSTKTTVKELSEVYPAQINPSVEIYAQVESDEGKALKSNQLKVDDEELYLAFDHVQEKARMTEHEEGVRSFFKSFRSDYENAIYYTNFDYIDHYFKDGSKIKRDYAKFVIDHRDIPGYHYDFQLNDVTSFNAVSDKKFELTSYETFDYRSAKESTIYYEREKKYVISYENDTYYIEEINNIDTKKTKR